MQELDQQVAARGTPVQPTMVGVAPPGSAACSVAFDLHS